MTNNWQEVAYSIDKTAKETGGRMMCSCPNVAGHANGDRAKSFTVMDDPGSVFGIKWGCFTCGPGNPGLNEILFNEGHIKKPPSDKEKKKTTKPPSDAILQVRAKKAREAAERKAKHEEKKAELAARKAAGEVDDSERTGIYLAATYRYTDENGDDYVEDRRWQFKSHPGEKIVIPYHFRDGRWDKGLTPVEFNPETGKRDKKIEGAQPYYVPLRDVKELSLHVKKGGKVALFEGGKSTDIFRALETNIFGTCHQGGSKTPWDKRWTLTLIGAEVVYIFIDNDASGRKWGYAIATALLAAGVKCKIIDLPDLKEDGDDIEQYLELHSSAELIKFLNNAEFFGPDELEPSASALPDATFKNTDLYNAERIAARFGHILKHCDALGWMYFDGKRWINNDKAIGRFAGQNARLIQLEAEAALKDGNTEEHARLYKWAFESEQGSSIRDACKLAKDQEKMMINSESFDNDPYLLNLQNGVLDLRTRKLYKHQKNLTARFFCSQISPVAYDPKAECPVFDAFLDNICDGDKQKQKFIMRCLGYTLSGLIIEECMFFVYGRGRNGKSKLIEVVYTILGTYAKAIPTGALMWDPSKPTANHEIAAADGARMITASETEQGQRLGEAQVKLLVGGTTMGVRDLYRSLRQMKPKFKIWMDGNYKPEVKGTDAGIKEKLYIITLNKYIPREKRDKFLMQKFFQELPGILNRLLDGFEDYYNNGKANLAPTEEVLTDGENFFIDQDGLAGFKDRICVTGPGTLVTAKALFEAYIEDCKDEGIEEKYRLGQRRFYDRIEALEMVESKHNNLGRYFKGIGLKSQSSVQTNILASVEV